MTLPFAEQGLVSAVARYGFALLVTGIAVLLTFLFESFVERTLFLFFFSAVLVSAWSGGRGPGLLTTVLSVAVANYFFITPLDRWAKGPGDALALLVFGLVAVILSSLSESRRSALRLAEQEAKQAAESEARFRAMADAAPVLIWTCDTAGRRTYFNRSWLEFTGRDERHELGNGWADAIHPEDVEAYRARYLSSLSTREPFRLEYRLRHRDDKYRWILDTGVPRVSSQGEFTGLIGSCVDITERKEAEDIQHFLLEAARLLASSLDLEATLRQVTELLVPRFADYCLVHLLTDDGSFRQVAARHADPDKLSLLEELGQHYRPDPSTASSMVARAWKTGLPMLMTEASLERWSMLHGPEVRRISRDLGPRTHAVLPLIARGAAIGTLSVGTSTSDRRYDLGDKALRDLLELFAGRAALAIEHARLYTEVRLAHERDVRTSQLESQLMQARLEALRTQLNPHFLFNALNTIAMLVRRQANTSALEGIVGLSQLLRQVLDRRSTPEVCLGEELALVEHYLTVERLRFQDRLGVEVRVAPDILEAQVPSLILQPLVENAVRHGIGRRREAGRIEISGRRHNGTLRLEVRDNGPGFPEGWDPESSGGIGLANTRERLQRLYGDTHRFKLRNSRAGGAIVSVTIPFRTAPPRRYLEKEGHGAHSNSSG